MNRPDVDMNKDDREAQGSVEEREREDDDDRESKRRRPSCVATTHCKPRRAEVL